MPTVNVDASGQLLYAGTDPYLVVNNDDTHPIYLSQQQGVNGADNQLPPQASVALTGPWYASTLTQGLVAEALVYPDATQWDNPVGVQIALNALGLATADNQATQIGHESSIASNTSGTELNTGSLGLLGYTSGSVAGPLTNTESNTSTTAANVATSNGYLGGTSPGALVGSAGLTVAKDLLHANTGVTTEIAALIASGSASGTPGGTPLLNGRSTLLNDTGGSAQTVAAGSTIFPTTGAFTGCGYQIQIKASIPATDATPFLEVTMAWYDSSIGLSNGQLAAESWVIPVGVTTAVTVYGKGPTKGNDLQVQIKNYCTTETATVSILIEGTTHHITRDDWRSETYNNVPGYTIPSMDPRNLILAAHQVTTSTAVNLILPIYCGQAEISFQSASANARMQIEQQSPALGGGLSILPQSMTGQYTVTLGRGPAICILSSTSGSITMTVAIIGIEYTS